MLKSSGKIFHTYSWREKVQQYINITQKWKRNETDGSRTFDCHSQIWRILYGNRKKIIGYNASPFFLNVQGKMQGAWQSPKMLPIMVHGQAFCIINDSLSSSLKREIPYDQIPVSTLGISVSWALGTVTNTQLYIHLEWKLTKSEGCKLLYYSS